MVRGQVLWVSEKARIGNTVLEFRKGCALVGENGRGKKPGGLSMSRPLTI